MKVNENNLRFSGKMAQRSATTRIVLHHSASDPSTTISDIHRWHQGQGWSGIGYHYVIHSDGSIHRGRPEWARGSHAYQDSRHEANSNGIGICLAGNFQTGKPTSAQMESVTWLIRDIWTRFPDIAIIGHKDVMPTACPGKNFPWGELNKRLEGLSMAEPWKEKLMQDADKAGLIDLKVGKHKPDEPATKWFVLAVALNLLKVIKGGK